MKTVRYYDGPDGWIEYIKKDGVIYGSAHATDGKYSRNLLRALKKGIKQYKKIVTELRYNYLIDFYSRHYKVKSIGNNFYTIEEV